MPQDLGQFGEVDDQSAVPRRPVGVVAVDDPEDAMIRLARFVQQSLTFVFENPTSSSLVE